MTREEVLKEELKQLELDKENKQKKRCIQHLKDVGKCFVTHRLDRYMTAKKAYQFIAVHLTDRAPLKGYNDYFEGHYKLEKIYVRKNDNLFEITSNETHMRSQDIDMRYEITLDQFNIIKNDFIAFIQAGVDRIRNDFTAVDYTSCGDFSDGKRMYEHLDSMNIEFIDFADRDGQFKKGNLSVFEVLRWNNYPYLYNSRLYKLQGWLDLVEAISAKIYKEALHWGGSIYERDLPRIELLNKFVETQRGKNGG